MSALILAAIFATLSALTIVGFANRRNERDAKVRRAAANGRRV
jgi:hypothetical protein